MFESTQVRLLVNAERLYALEGIERTSLRQIAEAAGQRNPAAVQYHFGSKVELQRAIVRYRMAPYSRRQVEMCDALVAEGRTLDVRGLVEASLLPFAEDEPADSHFVQYLAELMKDPDRFVAVHADLDDEVLEGPRLLEARLNQALADLPHELRFVRLNLAFNAGLSAIARARGQRAHEQRDGIGVASLPTTLLVADLIETVTAFIGAPAPVGIDRGAERAVSAPA